MANDIKSAGKNQIVKKSNILIEAHHTKQLDVRAVRLIAQAAARITIKDKDFQVYRVPLKSITTAQDVYNKIDNDSLVIDKITDQLLSNVIRLPSKDKDGQNTGKSFVKYSYFSKCKYVAGTGYVEVQFHPDLKDHFLQLKNNFTQLSLETLCALPSTYSYRLYELLKQYAQGGLKKREFKLSDLQDMLGVKPGPKSSYRRYPKFKEKVILPAQKNFEKFTDLLFEFRGWAESGRAYTHIEFSLFKNKKYLQGSLFDRDPIGDIDRPDKDEFAIPQQLIDSIPNEQWENKEIGCRQVCNEIFRKEGLDTLSFYIDHVKKLDAQKTVSSWGKTIRIAWKNDLYGQHLKLIEESEKKEKEQLDLAQKEMEEQAKRDREAKKEKLATETLDPIIDKLVSGDKSEEFSAFVLNCVETHENKIMRQRFKADKGLTQRNMQRRYVNQYLQSIL